MSKKRKVTKYRANAFGKKSPFIAFVKGKRVGVGAAIEAKPTPPALPFTIAEATSEQYEELFKRGLTKWVESYEETNEISDASEPDTGTA